MASAPIPPIRPSTLVAAQAVGVQIQSPKSPVGSPRPGSAAAAPSVRALLRPSSDGARTGDPSQVANPASIDVSLSSEARRAGGAKSFEREVLASFERRLSADELALFEQAGRSAYLDSIAEDADRSAEGTARRILGGITGYIFGAFRLARGELAREDIDTFEREALRGFERGFGQAQELLEGLGVLSRELAGELGETAELVRGGIREFAEERRSALPS